MNIIKKLSLIAPSCVAIAVPIATSISCGSTSGDKYEFIQKGAQDGNKYVEAKFAGQKITGKKLSGVMSDPENPRWQVALKNLQDSGTEAGFTTTTQIIKEQNGQNTWLTANPADAYVLGATDDTVSAFMKNLHKTTPVIAYDRLIHADSEAYNWYVTFDSKKVGKIQGLAIINHLYGLSLGNEASDKEVTDAVQNKKFVSDKYILTLAGDPADNNARLFFDGAKNIIAKAMSIDSHLKWGSSASSDFEKVAQEKWDYAKGKALIATQILSIDNTKTRIAAILCPNDGMAQAAITAMRQTGVNPQNVFVTGQDANNYALTSIYEENGQDMTIFKPDSMTARIAVAVAAKLVTKNNATVDEVTDFIKIAYPSMTGKWVLNTSDYHVKNSDPTSKVINTVTLDPFVINKANIEDFFIVKKS